MNVNGKDRTRRDRNRDRDSDIDSEAELDELREEIMGADDARTAGRGKVGQGRGLEETLEEIGFGTLHLEGPALSTAIVSADESQEHIIGGFWYVVSSTRLANQGTY